MWFAESECLRVALTSQFVDDRTTWITQAHHLRTFVDGLTCRIVDSLPQNLHIVIGFHQYNL